MAVVLAYHGCDKTTAQALLSGSLFVPSNKPYDWLGSGSYFWEEDILRAYQWALERRPLAPCGVGAVIELGNCLDLTKQRGITLLKFAYASYTALQILSRQPIPQNQDAKDSRPGDLARISHRSRLYVRSK